MRERILTIARLRQCALGELGLMTNGSYDVFMRQARRIASQERVINPKLILDLVYINSSLSMSGLKETPYLISPNEWNDFVLDARVLLESMPRVYVIDGDKFTAPA